MSVTRRGLARALVKVVPFALLVFVLVMEWNGIPGQRYRDSLAYFDAAQHARLHEPLYPTDLEPGPHEFEGAWPYLYPPPLAALLSVTPATDYRTFDRAWLVLELIAFWAFAAALARLHRGEWDVDGTLRWGAALFVVPGSLLAIHFANVEPVVWALVGLGLALPMVGGALLAVAAAIKVTPLWALLPILARRPRKSLPAALAAGAVLVVISAWRFGFPGLWRLCGQWLTEILPSVSQGQFWGGSLAVFQNHLGPLDILQNLSLTFLPVQLALLAGWDYQGGPLPIGVVWYLRIAGLLVPATVAWLTRRTEPAMQASLTLVAAALSAPITRPYALPFLLLPVALRLRHRSACQAG